MTPQMAICDVVARAQAVGIKVVRDARLGYTLHSGNLSLGLLVIGNEVDLVSLNKDTGTRSVTHCRSDYLKVIRYGFRWIGGATA